MLIPATNTTCEIEYARLAPDLQVHTARLGKDGDTPFSPGLAADVAYQSKLLGLARVEVIALVQTSASLFTENYDAVTIASITKESGVPAVTSAQAIGHALKALGKTRIALATPYWPEVIALAKRYFETNFGLTVVAAESLGAADSYAIGKMDAGLVQEVFDRIDRPEIEVLVVPGGNFPTLDRIEAWERRFGKPVITTNQAALWGVRRAMKLDTPLAGWGQLLARMPPG
jgi:maleate cis-trans isomerase